MPYHFFAVIQVNNFTPELFCLKFGFYLHFFRSVRLSYTFTFFILINDSSYIESKDCYGTDTYAKINNKIHKTTPESKQHFKSRSNNKNFNNHKQSNKKSYTKQNHIRAKNAFFLFYLHYHHNSTRNKHYNRSSKYNHSHIITLFLKQYLYRNYITLK